MQHVTELAKVVQVGNNLYMTDNAIECKIIITRALYNHYSIEVTKEINSPCQSENARHLVTNTVYWRRVRETTT